MREFYALRIALLLCLAVHNNSCNSAGLTYAFDLDQPINFVMTDRLRTALDEDGQRLYQSAALHAAAALGTEAAFTQREDAPLLVSENAPVQLTLGDVDCIGDRAGYVRWRPNNVLQVCPSMLHERSALMIHSLIMHELGHVLGGNHVDCDGESLMAPDLSCPTRRFTGTASNDPRAYLWYSGTDLRELCRHTSGGACR